MQKLQNHHSSRRFTVETFGACITYLLAPLGLVSCVIFNTQTPMISYILLGSNVLKSSLLQFCRSLVSLDVSLLSSCFVFWPWSNAGIENLDTCRQHPFSTDRSGRPAGHVERYWKLGEVGCSCHHWCINSPKEQVEKTGKHVIKMNLQTINTIQSLAKKIDSISTEVDSLRADVTELQAFATDTAGPASADQQRALAE